MPETTKKPGGSAKNDSKAPLLASPSKSKTATPSPEKKTAKDAAVKLPSIAPSIASPTKRASKSESGGATVPTAAASKTSTPTSPSRPNAKPTKPGGKASLAPVAATGQRPPNVAVSGGKEILGNVTTPVPHVAELTQEQAQLDGPQLSHTDTMPSKSGGDEYTEVSALEVTSDAEAMTIAAAAETAEAAAQAVAAQAQEEEAARLRKENGNGTIQLIYEQYDEFFPIVDGSTTQASIDDVYCLSFVMPNCLVHLSYHTNTERFEREGNGIFDSLVREDPRGMYHDLIKDHTYYVVVEQEADQLRRDQDATKAKWAPAVQQEKLEKNDGRGFESCSCIYGNPCADEYGCKDWHARFAVATANGWKGF